MSNVSESPLIRKIRALRAKATGAGVTEAEAAAFAAKVQELLVANGLSMQDLHDKTADEEHTAGQYHDDKKWSSPARKVLLRAVCRFYMCDAIGTIGDKTRWTIVGKPSNVFVALDMLDYLITTTVRLSNEYARQTPGANKIDWRRGCMLRLAERLDEMRRMESQKKPEWRSSGNPGNLPALFATEQQQVKLWMMKNMNIRTQKSRVIRQGNDAAHGRSAADGISLHRQVGGASGRLMIGGK